MFKPFLALSLALFALSPPAPAQSAVGNPAPEFKATKWYNGPPISVDDLKGKAVLIQVFRTW